MVNQRLAAVAERTLIWCHRRHRHAAISGGYFEGVQLGLHVIPLDVLHREPVPTRGGSTTSCPRQSSCAVLQRVPRLRVLTTTSWQLPYVPSHTVHAAYCEIWCILHSDCMSWGYRSISQPKEPLQAMSMMRCSVTSSCTIDFPIIFHMVPALQQLPYLVSRTRAERHMPRLPATWKPHDSEFS
jgi:hypothetical protein